jgi:dihydropteroate synthase
VGFAKDQAQNLAVINRLEELHTLGCPLLLGASRKRVIGNVLGLPTDQRLEGTVTTTVFAVLKGCMFVRVHDVAENVRAIRMAEAILGER